MHSLEVIEMPANLKEDPIYESATFA
jgi:hypothetical protein